MRRRSGGSKRRRERATSACVYANQEHCVELRRERETERKKKRFLVLSYSCERYRRVSGINSKESNEDACAPPGQTRPRADVSWVAGAPAFIHLYPLRRVNKVAEASQKWPLSYYSSISLEPARRARTQIRTGRSQFPSLQVSIKPETLYTLVVFYSLAVRSCLWLLALQQEMGVVRRLLGLAGRFKTRTATTRTVSGSSSSSSSTYKTSSSLLFLTALQGFWMPWILIHHQPQGKKLPAPLRSSSAQSVVIRCNYSLCWNGLDAKRIE